MCDLCYHNFPSTETGMVRSKQWFPLRLRRGKYLFKKNCAGMYWALVRDAELALENNERTFNGMPGFGGLYTLIWNLLPWNLPAISSLTTHYKRAWTAYVRLTEWKSLSAIAGKFSVLTRKGSTLDEVIWDWRVKVLWILTSECMFFGGLQ